MSVTFEGDKVWRTLTLAAKSPVAAVAVAYFGKGAAKLLPLRPGSRLVVNASEGAVKSGLTCPADLKKLMNSGVRIYSVENLHAKVFVYGRKAFVGSANVSQRSAGTLVEAIIATTDRNTVTAARTFVRKLCFQEIGPETIDHLAKIYRPPRITGDRQPQRTSGDGPVTARQPPVRLAQLKPSDLPEGSEGTAEAGRKTAIKHQKKSARYKVDYFFWIGKCAFRRGDIAIQITNEGDGRRMVSPPGNVVHTRLWRGNNRMATFVYVELPTRRRLALEPLAKRLGRGAKKRLNRGGLISPDFAERLIAAFD